MSDLVYMVKGRLETTKIRFSEITGIIISYTTFRPAVGATKSPMKYVVRDNFLGVNCWSLKPSTHS
jgi:hypothetical protein